MKKEAEVNMRLVGDDEFDEETLSEASDNEARGEKVKLHTVRASRRGSMGGFAQVLVFLMFWSVVMGICMLVLHIIARTDSNRQLLIIVGVSVAWIVMINVFAFAAYIIDKYQAFTKQPRMSESLAHAMFILGGVVGGWLAICLTCYRPPGTKNEKISGFICRGMLCSAIGIALVVFLILRVIVPNVALLFTPFMTP